MTLCNPNDEWTGDEPESELSAVVVPLLKGALYAEASPAQWRSLIHLQARVQDYLRVLGLTLVLDEAEGYAFVKSLPVSEDGEVALPRLVARRALSFPVSLLVALLRKKLVEFDASGGETRLVLSREEISEFMSVFLPDTTNETRLLSQLDAHIAKVVELGFLKRLKGDDAHFEVRRIIKAFVDAQWLSELDVRLAEYRACAEGQWKGGPRG